MEFAPGCRRHGLYSAMVARWCHPESTAGAANRSHCRCGVDTAGATCRSPFVRNPAPGNMAVAGNGGHRNCAASAVDAFGNFTHEPRRSSGVSRASATCDFRIGRWHDYGTHSRRFTFRCTCDDPPPCRSMDLGCCPVVCGGGFFESGQPADVDARPDVHECQSSDDTFTAAVV